MYLLYCCFLTGELQKVRIKKDSAGTAPGWHLKLVKIKDVLRNRVYEFPCSKWIYSGSYECYERSIKDEFNSKKKNIFKAIPTVKTEWKKFEISYYIFQGRLNKGTCEIDIISIYYEEVKFTWKWSVFYLLSKSWWWNKRPQ